MCKKVCKSLADACDDCIDEAYTRCRLAQLNRAKPGEFVTDNSRVVRSKPFINDSKAFETP